jgi:hypothetical protein
MLFVPFYTILAQNLNLLAVSNPSPVFAPLDTVTLLCVPAGRLSVRDAAGREYVSDQAAGRYSFLAGGAAGSQSATLYDAKGKMLAQTTFQLKAATTISDHGKWSELFKLLYKGMLVYAPDGYEEVDWNRKTYRYFVNWVLDNNNVIQGMKYFSPYSRDLADLLAANQQKDGMIWSFVQPDRDNFHYYETAYSYLGYFDRNNGAWFVRQPTENHVEYNYVGMIWQHWKASGDCEWMQGKLASAMAALDYCVTDTLKWSKRFQLLKRPYCIDSWDFQVDDEYTPAAPLSPTMVVIPGKTKFGIFFGDNTGYCDACNQMAEMLQAAGHSDLADKYRRRGKEILHRLIALSWNGRFFTHFIDEDPTVKRNLGVDEKAQIAQGNMYSLNRGLSSDMNTAIINTYLDLRTRLPQGSPGEWYAIYPPFERGFSQHDAKWQYMNAGVAGHAIGELARGAYENGYEDYATDILMRTYDLIKRRNNRFYFAYTGAIPDPPATPIFQPVDISSSANMDLWDIGDKNVFKWMAADRPGNDMRGLPTGAQRFHDIPFNVLDPAKNKRRAAVAVSTKPGFPRALEISVNIKAATVYLLHSSSDNTPSTFAGAVSFRYSDGSERSRNIVKFKDVTNWWFAELDQPRAGVAWAGPNPVSTRVGVCWLALENPEPDKEIKTLVLHAPIEGGIYTVLAITLADQPFYIQPSLESFGGPDNWAAANAMAALMEGLAGVKNRGLALDQVCLSPRWITTGSDSVTVVAHYPASDGYVAYRYHTNRSSKKISMTVTGSGHTLKGHILLPVDFSPVSVVCDNRTLPFTVQNAGESRYVDFEIGLDRVEHICINGR